MFITNEMQEALQSGSIAPRWLVWIKAKNVLTSEEEFGGFWTGEGERTFTFGEEERTYVGAGALMSMPDITYEAGAIVQMQRMVFSLASPEVQAAVFQYDARLAPVEVHLALFDPETDALLGIAPAFIGWVEEPEVRDSNRSGITLTLSVASSARAGTRTLASKKSPESMRLRNANDRGRDYADIASEVSVSWGGEDKRGYFVGV